MIVCILFWVAASNVAAAPDPSEVETAKEEASLQVIGTVTSHHLVEDLSVKGEPKQKRKMKLSINEVIKNSSEIKNIQNVEVFYTYIPKWSANQYNGSGFLDVETGDVIEIWLNKTSGGWKSALGAATYEHKTYVNDRSEIISEPFAHRINRIINENILNGPYLSAIVLVFLVAVLFTIGLVARKKKHTAS